MQAVRASWFSSKHKLLNLRVLTSLSPRAVEQSIILTAGQLWFKVWPFNRESETLMSSRKDHRVFDLSDFIEDIPLCSTWSVKGDTDKGTGTKAALDFATLNEPQWESLVVESKRNGYEKSEERGTEEEDQPRVRKLNDEKKKRKYKEEEIHWRKNNWYRQRGFKYNIQKERTNERGDAQYILEQ